MNSIENKLSFDGEELFLVDGRLTELQTARTKVNLLAQIEEHLQAKNLASGVAGVLGGMHGMVANSAMLALYDGEDMYNFATVIGDQIVCGAFEKANQFKNGDSIRAVVSKRGDVLYAHSVLRDKDQLLLMPLTTFAGKKALFKSSMKIAWRFSMYAWIVFALLFSFFLIGKSVALDKLVKLGLMVFMIPPLLIYPMEYWTYRSFKHFGERASVIFKVFGFPRPDDLDVRGGMTHYPDGSYGFGGINCKLALDKHKEKYGIKG